MLNQTLQHIFSQQVIFQVSHQKVPVMCWVVQLSHNPFSRCECGRVRAQRTYWFGWKLFVATTTHPTYVVWGNFAQACISSMIQFCSVTTRRRFSRVSSLSFLSSLSGSKRLIVCNTHVGPKIIIPRMARFMYVYLRVCWLVLTGCAFRLGMCEV